MIMVTVMALTMTLTTMTTTMTGGEVYNNYFISPPCLSQMADSSHTQNLENNDQLIFCLFLSAGDLSRFIQHVLSQLDLWKGPFAKVKESLRSGRDLCERWSQACETLTVQFWKRYGPHPWKGDKFVPENLNAFASRLEEVNDILQVRSLVNSSYIIIIIFSLLS